MSKILKNVTGSNISIVDTGITVAANSNYTIPSFDYPLWASSNNIVMYIGNASIIVNDGSFDLDSASGIALLQGNFKQSDFISTLKHNDRLKVEIDYTPGANMEIYKAGTTANDTTPGYLDTKIVNGSNKISKVVLNPGANESLSIDVVPGNIDHATLSNLNSSSHTHLTQTEKTDLTDGGDSTLHYHASDRDRTNHTGTQLSTSISDFVESAQDAVGNSLVDSSNIDFTYNDASNNITADLTNTTVSPGSYGTASKTVSITVDAKGRLTSSIESNIAITASQVTDFSSAADARITLQKGAANGLATLDGTSKIPAAQLPSFVDDVVEYANLASFPVTGETGKIYVALDTNKTYRWSGSIYTEISPSDVNSVFGRTGIVTAQSGDYTAIQVTNTPSGNIAATTVQAALNELDAEKQPLDATLTSLAAYNTNGILTQTAPDTFTGRTITGTASNISVTNGNGVAGNPTLDLINAGTAGTYGSASSVPVITTDIKGRVTSVTPTTISVTSANVSDFNEAAQDAVGTILIDSSSVDFTYNDGLNTITAVVLPAGVDHNSLQNFVANSHIDHSTVSVLAGTGLSGGGDITASRTLNLSNTTVIAGSYGSASQVPSITVDAQGRLTVASNVTITSSAIGAQPLDADLTALAALTTTGLVTRTATDTYTTRTLTAGTGISVTNNDGVLGNPTVGITAVGTAGTYGSASLVPVITTNSSGQVSSVTNTSISITASQVSDFSTAADARITLQKGTINGIATLDDSGKVPAAQLPAFVDDVLEYANLAVFPVTGSTGIIYVALDTNKTYRWSGSAYVEISPSDVNSVFGRTGNVVAVFGDYNASQVTNTPSGNIAATTVQAALNELDAEKQPIDSDLTALAALSTNGIIVRTGAGTVATRTIVPGLGLAVSNGDGVSSNPTIAMSAVGTAGTYGTANSIPIFTTNSLGQVSTVTNTPISLPTSQLTGILPIANGGTNNSSAYTAGSVIFSNGTFLTQDNSNFFYDNTNKRLGIGVIPSYDLHVQKPTVQPVFKSTSTTGISFQSMQNDATQYTEHGIYGSANGTTIFSNAGASASFLTSSGSKLVLGVYGDNPVIIGTNATEKFRVNGNGNVGIGINAPSATLHLKAGTVSANTAPLKIVPGAIMTTPEAGAVEFDGTDLYYTTGLGVRRIVGNPLTVSGVTAGTYGSSTQISSFTVNNLGIITAASNITPSLTSANISDFDSMVITAPLTGFALGSPVDIVATDTILQAFGKLQAQIDGETILRTTADNIQNSNITNTNVTALGFTAAVGGVYLIEYTIKFRTAATTTGFAVTINTSNGAAGTLTCLVNMPIAADGTAALYSGTINSLGDIVIGTGVQTVQPAWFLCTIRGIFECTTAGIILPQFRSEVLLSSVNFGANSIAKIKRIV